MDRFPRPSDIYIPSVLGSAYLFRCHIFSRCDRADALGPGGGCDLETIIENA